MQKLKVNQLQSLKIQCVTTMCIINTDDLNQNLFSRASIKTKSDKLHCEAHCVLDQCFGLWCSSELCTIKQTTSTGGQYRFVFFICCLTVMSIKYII